MVPTYNYGHFISETLECLLAQTYENWECIIVDDGSTDDTAERVSRFMERDGRFKFLRQENALQAVAKNNGLRNSTGEYIQLLDADDLIEPQKLEKQVEYLEARPEVDIVYGSMRYFETETPDERLYWVWGENKPWMPETSGSGKEILIALVRQNILAINAPLMRRRVVDAVGLFVDRLPPAEDWDYWLRCAAAGMHFQFEDLPGTLSLTRSHPSSSSHDRRKMYASMMLIRKKIEALTGDAEVLALNREQMRKDQQTLALETISHGPLGACLREMIRAALLSGRIKHSMKWLACAAAAPFVPRQRLKMLVTSSWF
ncbi:MAG TPA: glycosyltransferase family 2 protein [Pyrinomonadaceae bacterium]|nr:glycosyltransferase family 2 protein [Pyrinomonadaceae bacterium]